MNKAYLAGFLLAFVVFCTAPTKADSIATIDLSANFATGGSFVSVTFPTSAPLFGVTGQFTVDEDTGAISSWNVNFLGSLGASYQLSAQNGGIASASCVGVTPCPGPPSSFDQGYWDFSFANSGAFLKIDTLQRPPSSSPFFAGETLQLCPVEITFYPGNVSDDSPACAFTSSASFDGETGFLYVRPDLSTSGVLTVTSVVSTSEPAESTTLLLGISLFFGCAISKKYKAIPA